MQDKHGKQHATKVGTWLPRGSWLAPLKGTHFGIYVYLLSYGELDEKIDTTLYSTINIKLPPAAV